MGIIAGPSKTEPGETLEVRFRRCHPKGWRRPSPFRRILQRSILFGIAAVLASGWGSGEVRPAAAGIRAAGSQADRAAERDVPAALIQAAPTPVQQLPPALPAPNVPSTAVVWNRTGTGIYLWEDPGQGILAFLENGAVLELLEQWQGSGGVPFGLARAGAEAVWVDMRHVHRIRLPESGFDRILSPGGAFLYADQGETVLQWLPFGTPIIIGEAQGDWVVARLLVGGESGRLRADALGDGEQPLTPHQK